MIFVSPWIHTHFDNYSEARIVVSRVLFFSLAQKDDKVHIKYVPVCPDCRIGGSSLDSGVEG